ncbi:hypothetical protein DSO57_1024145 [Entomophthora muscae]|uniref:Uncharacterized protein n=1 Tax=Entomophthora muscae TaxID=34485 RepID=A0ACC2UCE2_9FUNG|nr:hypothetical protein DSO57_1024145 [Entomophthora muscae]
MPTPIFKSSIVTMIPAFQLPWATAPDIWDDFPWLHGPVCLILAGSQVPFSSSPGPHHPQHICQVGLIGTYPKGLPHFQEPGILRVKWHAAPFREKYGNKINKLSTA